MSGNIPSAQTGNPYSYFPYMDPANTITNNILQNLNIENPILLAIVSVLIYSVVSSQTKDLGIHSINLVKWIYNSIYQFIGYLFFSIYKCFNNKIKKIRKEIIVESITDDRHTNELYKAVQWYLANNTAIDYIRETPVKLTFEKRIDDKDSSSHKVNQMLLNGKETQFKFNNHELHFVFDTNLITVYAGEAERKKEKRVIKLWTEIFENATNDVLAEFCEYCMNEYAKSLVNTKWVQQVFTHKNNKWESKAFNNHRKLETVILQNDLKNNIKADIELFINSEEYYKVRDIPYTRGYMFYGKPGTGKTSMIRALSLFTKRHIHMLNLNNVSSDDELVDLLNGIDYKQTILVLEDVDCQTNVVKRREVKDDVVQEKDKKPEEPKQATELSIDGHKIQLGVKETHVQTSSSGRLTLSGLLNCLDGMYSVDGRIMIVTTNHINVLDDAFLREGRIDRKFLFDYCTKKQIEGMYNMYFNEPCIDRDLENIIDGRYSPAYISSLFLRYRNNPRDALKNINLKEDTPAIKPMLSPDSEDEDSESGGENVEIKLDKVIKVSKKITTLVLDSS
jgi:AAA+ superfamily predicted ATPase